MPDGDRIPVGVSGRWRRVFRSLAAGDPLERQADEVAGALASDLRRAGGLEGLGRFPGVLRDAATGVMASSGPTRGVMVGNSAEFTGALALALNDHLALVSPDPAALLLAERLVRRLALSKLERMITRLVGDKKYSAPELYARFREILSDEVIAKLVRQMLRHPTGEGLRAPNRRGRRISSKELLDTDLENL